MDHFNQWFIAAQIALEGLVGALHCPPILFDNRFNSTAVATFASWLQPGNFHPEQIRIHLIIPRRGSIFCPSF